MPHLREDEPFESSAGDHLISDRSWLPSKYFDWRDPDHPAWSLTTILQWCQPRHWLHETSRTLFGGHLGIKWPVVILGHLRHNVNRYFNSNECWRSHYASTPGAWSQDVNFRFEDMEIEQIDATIADLCAVITDSRTRLEQTMEDRTILAPEHIIVISSNDAHVGFPSDSTEFHSITPLPFNDPWDVRLTFF
jgi:hypothetical protein